MDDTKDQTSKLVCTEVLLPPLETIGQGGDTIRYRETQPAWQCSFSLDGKFLAVAYGSPNPCVRIWDRDDKGHWKLLQTFRGVHGRTVRSVAFAPIRKSMALASASFDGTIAIWEYVDDKDWECIAQLEGHDSEVKCVVWNRTGSLLATCGRDKSVWIWELVISNV
jgi:WD40 repeat protein